MDLVGLNWVAVVAVTLFHFILGSLWYSPMLMGNKWMSLMGMRKSDMKKEDMNKAMVGGLLSGLLVSIVLAAFVVAMDVVTFADGATIGLWAWIGFVIPTALMPVIYEKKHPMLFKIYIAYELIAFVLIGGILAIWI